MKVLVAVDSFKGSLSSFEAGMAVARGIERTKIALSEVYAVADGGEGSVEALATHKTGQFRAFTCRDAFHHPIDVDVFLFEENGILCAGVEAASIFGLHGHAVSYQTVEETNTFGVGELIKALVDAHVQKLLFFLGGTITTDAGLGLLQGLGVQLFDAKNHLISSTINPLFSFHHWDVSTFQQAKEICSEIEIVIGCDVNAPLFGKSGCALLYAPQKGANLRQQVLLERQLHYLQDYVKEDLTQPGCGAGGGCGAGMLLLGGTLTSGFEVISRSLELEKKIQDADWIVTGEGGMNEQTLQGKLPFCIAKLARQYRKPVIALCGQKTGNIDDLSACFDGIFSIQQGVYPLKEAIAHTAEYLEESAYQLFRLIHASKDR